MSNARHQDLSKFPGKFNFHEWKESWKTVVVSFVLCTVKRVSREVAFSNASLLNNTGFDLSHRKIRLWNAGILHISIGFYCILSVYNLNIKLTR